MKHPGRRCPRHRRLLRRQPNWIRISPKLTPRSVRCTVSTTGIGQAWKKETKQPDSSDAHVWHAEFLAQMGRNGQAISEIQPAEALDPLSLAVHAQAGRVFYLARNNKEATAEWERPSIWIPILQYCIHRVGPLTYKRLSSVEFLRSCRKRQSRTRAR